MLTVCGAGMLNAWGVGRKEGGKMEEKRVSSRCTA